MKNIWLTTLVSIVLLNCGCSTQFSEATATLSDEEISQLITDMMSAEGGIKGSSGTNNSNFDAVLNDNRVISRLVYHAGSGEGRPPASIFGVFDMNLFNPGWEANVESKDTNMNLANAVFIDSTLEDGSHAYAVGVQMGFASETDYQYFIASSSLPAEYYFGKDTFEVKMFDNHGNEFIFRTNDLSADYYDELSNAVQFDIYLIQDGYEIYMGQISTMANYSVQ